MIELQKCPECGREDTVTAPYCLCGYTFPPSLPKGQDALEQAKRKPKVWLALIPGLLTLALTAGVALPRWLEFSRVTGAITQGAKVNSGQGSAQDRLKCVDVYAITLKTSEFYVSENRPGAFWGNKNAPRDLSTVVEGMASNRCGEPLQKVRIRIDVRDDKGKRGSGWAEVGDLANGQAKAFERAWMARVTSYEIVEIR